MDEYIKREAVINRIKEYASEVYEVDLDSTEQFSEDVFADNFCNGLWSAIELIDDIPAADVATAGHAQWIEDGSGIIICPECKRGYNLIAKYTHYCPNCGVKMDGGDSDEAD